MVATPSTMQDIGSRAEAFNLPNFNPFFDLSHVSLAQYQNKPLIVSFICNHCPFVILIEKKFAELMNHFHNNGFGVIAINSNDVKHYPADAPEKMSEFASRNGFQFPYLFDESQEVAKSFKAACTPDFFVFDNNHELQYRGQFDAARPNNGVVVTGEDINKAAQSILLNQSITWSQTPSIGCNIKWKDGNAPEYFS